MTVPAAIHPVGSMDTFQHTLIVAGPGFGKTVFAGTAPKALFLTTDPEGTLSAAAMGSTAREWRIKTWENLNKAYAYLRDGGIKEMDLSWVIIDNASEAQSQGMKSNMANSRKSKPTLDEFVPTLDNHQRTQIMFIDMVKRFHDLPVNIMWTAWIETHEDNEGVEYYAPAVHGQKGAIAQQFAGLMNVVGYGEVLEDESGEEHRRVYFSHVGPNRGKDRYIALGKYRTDLTVPKMMSLIDSAVSKRKAAQPNASTIKRTATKASTTTRRRVARKA